MNAESAERLFGWLGTIGLLGILPIKLVRFLGVTSSGPLIGIAPSVLGPAGLYFLLLASHGRLSRLGPKRLALLVGAVSVTLECGQLIPRPGILARALYTFDFYDLGASILSVAAAYAFSAWVLRESCPVDAER